MKNVYLQLLSFISLLFVCFNSYGGPLFFGIQRQYPYSKYKQYENKNIVFLTPLTDEEKEFNLKRIVFGNTYRITQIDENKIVVAEVDNPKSKPITIKCSKVYELPCYLVDEFNILKDKTIGRKVQRGGEEYITSDVIWDTSSGFYIPSIVLSRGSYKEFINIDDAIGGKYYSLLSSVEKPADDAFRYGETKTITEDGMTKYSYQDNVIDILIFGNYQKFFFTIQNISDKSIKIVWNEAAFVGMDGKTSKIMHNGVKYSEKEGDQPASVIIRGAQLEDVAVPTSSVHYKSGFLGGWETDSMYPNVRDSKGREIRGKDGTVCLMLPIQIKETINEYLFIFDVVYKLNYPELAELDSYLIYSLNL